MPAEPEPRGTLSEELLALRKTSEKVAELEREVAVIRERLASFVPHIARSRADRDGAAAPA